MPTTPINLLLRSEKGAYGNPTFRLTEAELDNNLSTVQTAINAAQVRLDSDETTIAQHTSDIADIAVELNDIRDDIIGLGGGAGAKDDRYFSNNAEIIARGTGITHVKTTGLSTVTIPNGTMLKSICIPGVTADADAGNFTVKFVFGGTNHFNGSSSMNTSITTALRPRVYQVTNETGPWLGNSGVVSDDFMIVYDPGVSPQMQLTKTSAGEIICRIVGITAYDYWTIILGF